MTNDRWYSCTHQSPPEGVEVLTMVVTPEGESNCRTLLRRRTVWYLPGGTVRVYYKPTHWRLLNDAEHQGTW